MQLERIAFIGGGNMARALIGGLRAGGFEGRRIAVADPAAEQLSQIRAQFAVTTTPDNLEAVRGAQLVILAVKPQHMAEVAAHLKPAVEVDRPLLLSVAAGVRIDTLVGWLGGFGRVVRAMPNRPALLRRGVTALHAASEVSAGDKAIVEQVLQSVGSVVWLEREDLMDAVTAVSGSGPAYFFLLIELLENAARELGLPPEVARKLSIETAYGAACMARESHENGTGDPAQLRAEVTSRGGTTEAALAVFGDAGLRDIVRRAVTAAARRSVQLATQSGS